MRQVFSSTIALVIGTLGILADINVKTNTNQEAVEGTNTTLVCTFTPQDGIDISWSIDDGSSVMGRQLVSRNVVLDNRYSIVNQASLLINTVRQIDAGTYICSIYSSIDKRLYSSSVQLDVFYSPRFTLRKQGNTIRCFPYGNPMIKQVVYFINGTQQPRNVQQVIIDERFCNTFTCFGENSAGKGNRTEIYCPKVKISPEKPDDLGNQTLVGVLTSILIFLLLSVVMIIVYVALRPGPDFEQEHGRYDELFIDGPSSV